MKWIGKHSVFSDLLIGGVLLSPPDNQYSYELTLPNDDGTTGQVLTTDGNGVLTWTTPSSGTPITLNGTTVNGIATYASANTLDIESTLTYTSTILTLSGTSAANLPAIILQNDHAGSDGANIQFNKIQDGSDDDELGIISWFGDDDAGNQTQFASITGRIADASNNDEAGKLELKVKTNSTENQQALIATGDGTSSKVDVGIAHGASSTTAIAGEITLGVDLAITHGGTGASTAQAAIDALTAVSGASAGQRLTKDGSGNATWADATTGTTINGTTANGVGTYGGANTIDIESTLTYNSNTLTIGPPTATAVTIGTPANLAGQDGDRLTIQCGQSGSGTNIAGGQQTFWSGLGTGNKSAGMYTFLGAPADNLAGGTGTSRENYLFQIFADAGAANTAYTVLYDVNDVRNYFSTQVKANGVTVLTTNDNASHNADLAITADGAVSISSTDASNDITLNSAGEIELNADGGNIDFKDNTARLAKIDTDGLSFQDNTGAGIKFEGATNNAHQTTLSVVDPTGTRTINLPDDSGTVALQEKSIIVKNMGFYNTSTSAFYLPMLEYIAESTYVTSYVSSFVAPYDGKVIKVGPGWSNNSSSKTSTYKFFKNKQSSTQTGTTATTASFTTTIPEVTPTDWTFSKGEPIHIQVTNSASISSVSMTVTIELDLTT
jgi:membrane-bound inhibitor of C-type lysozyme